ncbi:unnamed protein product [Adineta ricciae]|uniref:Uncharacterized protein n=1 Tax=Adineta ricciae TaxID=249248 RepID=A0A814PAQ9_ADIRI|nr:unnamed protein product [Adineta ricciae]
MRTYSKFERRVQLVLIVLYSIQKEENGNVRYWTQSPLRLARIIDLYAFEKSVRSINRARRTSLAQRPTIVVILLCTVIEFTTTVTDLPLITITKYLLCQ